MKKKIIKTFIYIFNFDFIYFLQKRKRNCWRRKYLQRLCQRQDNDGDGVLSYAKDEETEEALEKLGAERKDYDYEEDEEYYWF